MDVDLNEADGQATHVTGLARAFAELGEDVRLLVAATKTASSSRLELDAVAVPNLGRRSFVETLRQARSFRPEIIYERRFSPKLGATVSLMRRIPYFLEINGLPELERTDSGNRGLRRARRIRRLAYRVTKRIFVPTERLADLLAERLGLPRSRFCVIPNGADLNLFARMDKTEARRVLGFPIEQKIVVYVGKLARWQGVETLVDSSEKLSHAPGVQVLVVGDGPSRESIAARITEKHLEAVVRLTGPMPHDRIPMVLAAADLCVAPFTRERNDVVGISPIKLFEYLAAGRPIVASDVEGVAEVVRDGGILVAPDSASDLASAIDGVLRNPDRLMNLERRAADLAKASSWKSRARMVLEEVRHPPQSKDPGR